MTKRHRRLGDRRHTGNSLTAALLLLAMLALIAMGGLFGAVLGASLGGVNVFTMDAACWTDGSAC